MSSHDQISKGSSFPLDDLLARSLPVRHFSVALQEYRKWPASKNRHFLNLGSLSRSLERLQSEHVLSLGAQGLRKERREWRSEPLSYCCKLHSRRRDPGWLKYCFCSCHTNAIQNSSSVAQDLMQIVHITEGQNDNLGAISQMCQNDMSSLPPKLSG